MNIVEEAMKLRNERYDRDKLLSITSDVITRFHLDGATTMHLWPNAMSWRWIPYPLGCFKLQVYSPKSFTSQELWTG